MHDHWRIAVGAMVIAALSVVLTACGSGEDANPHATEGSCPVPAGSGGRPKISGNAVGEEFRSADVSLTVTRTHTSSAYLLKNDDVHAQEDCEFVEISTTGRNDGTASIRLTCGDQVRTSLVDSSGRRYAPVGQLDQLLGNPGCRDRIDPGMGFEMTWIYAVPASARVVAFEFRDNTDPKRSTRRTARVPIRPS